MHYYDISGFAGMRMGIQVISFPMRCPAGVPNSKLPENPIPDYLYQIPDFSLLFEQLVLITCPDTDAG